MDHAHAAVFAEVDRVLLVRRHSVHAPGPTNVRVPEAANRAKHARAVANVRTVRVALDIRMGVMLAVVSDPVHRPALDRHRAEDRKDVLDRLVGLERAMGQQTVVANRDPKSAYEVHHGKDDQVAPSQQVVVDRDWD